MFVDKETETVHCVAVGHGTLFWGVRRTFVGYKVDRICGLYVGILEVE